MKSVLVLGQGFVGKYLADLLKAHKVDYASTTTSGREDTIAWCWSERADDDDVCDPYSMLPAAESIVITFPLKGGAEARHLITGYLCYHRKVHGDTYTPFWVYLGSTRPFKGTPSTRQTRPDLIAGGPRVEAEEYVISAHAGCVLNLAGLWGGERVPDKWSRFYSDKEQLRNRLRDRSLHLIHGADAARSIFAIIGHKDKASRFAGRWLVSDEKVYDVLQIFVGADHIRSFLEDLMDDDEVKEMLGADKIGDIEMGAAFVTKRIDSSHFWSQLQLKPKYVYAVGEPDPYPSSKDIKDIV
ncbi:hypothetical protein GGI20_003423 [Coemansia sp. BCRC 34301]|nr:hypothetical protein GGI20_003423 [Coemansia sp. BCRC 34301]